MASAGRFSPRGRLGIEFTLICMDEPVGALDDRLVVSDHITGDVFAVVREGGAGPLEPVGLFCGPVSVRAKAGDNGFNMLASVLFHPPIMSSRYPQRHPLTGVKFQTESLPGRGSGSPTRPYSAKNAAIALAWSSDARST